jgi:hypothetical protein
LTCGEAKKSNPDSLLEEYAGTIGASRSRGAAPWVHPLESTASGPVVINLGGQRSPRVGGDLATVFLH